MTENGQPPDSQLEDVTQDDLDATWRTLGMMLTYPELFTADERRALSIAQHLAQTRVKGT